jgi:hypothetical protein
MALKHNLTVRQGEDFAEAFRATRNGQVIPLTGYIVEAQIRKRAGSDDIVEEFDCTVLDADAGTFLLSLPGDRSAEITAGRDKFHYKSRYEYDVRLTSPESVVIIPIEGYVLIDPSCTR